MTRPVRALLLGLFGTTVARVGASDAALRYVRDGMRPWLVVSGAALTAVAVALMVLDSRRRTRPQDEGHHGHGSIVAWALLAPVLTVWLVAPPSLGAFAALQARAATVRPHGVSEELPRGRVIDMTLTEYEIRSIYDDRRTLDARTDRLLGFVTPNPDGGWDLTRMVLNCCAADATVLRIRTQEAPPQSADQWVTVEGTWSPPVAVRPLNPGSPAPATGRSPVLRVLSVTPVAEPRDPYEY